MYAKPAFKVKRRRTAPYFMARKSSTGPSRSRTIARSTSTPSRFASRAVPFGCHFIAFTLEDPAVGTDATEGLERARRVTRVSAVLRGNASPRKIPAHTQPGTGTTSLMRRT
jgi:hypothetical protein